MRAFVYELLVLVVFRVKAAVDKPGKRKPALFVQTTKDNAVLIERGLKVSAPRETKYE